MQVMVPDIQTQPTMTNWRSTTFYLILFIYNWYLSAEGHHLQVSLKNRQYYVLTTTTIKLFESASQKPENVSLSHSRVLGLKNSITSFLIEFFLVK